jgi:hypothetical protein
MHTHFWGLSFGEVQIGPTLLDDNIKKLVKVSHSQSRGLRG